MNGNEVMLDTNIVSAAIDQEAAVLAKLADVSAVVPITVLGELYYGVYASSRVERNLQRTEKLLEDFTPFPGSPHLWWGRNGRSRRLRRAEL